jgi:ATP-dependent Clp protease ATP-binding subunit ClpX
MDVEVAERGIVFVDEVDKIARRGSGMKDGSSGRDIRGEGVQQALLKLLEGGKVFVPYNITQHWNKHDFVQMDTSNILFILAGTFTDLYRGGRTRPAGFGRSKENSAVKSAEERISVEDLQRYGMLAEFVGRVPVMVELEELSEAEMVRIVTEPPDAILKEYKQLLSMDKIELDFSEAAIKEIVREAKRRKLGARGLRTIFEETMQDLMFEAPEMAGKKVTISLSDVRKKLGRE